MALTFWDFEMHIKTAKTQLRYDNPAQYELWLQKIAITSGHPPDCFNGHEDIDDQAPPAIAYVNHGRWVADCPSGCGGAMLLDPELPFMCGECFNAELHGRWRLVDWPANRTEIESWLELRKLAHTANWSLGETIEQLREENRIHGIKS